MTYNTKLIVMIKEKNLRNYEVAEDCNMNGAIFSQIITGRINPTKIEKDKIAATLQCKVAEIF